MEKNLLFAAPDAPLQRIYIMAATLRAFKGRRHVDVHIFRHGATEEEMTALEDLNLVGAPDPSVPPEVLQGATREAALRCVLEAFTAEESRALLGYLEQRYAEHIEKITVSPWICRASGRGALRCHPRRQEHRVHPLRRRAQLSAFLCGARLLRSGRP